MPFLRASIIRPTPGFNFHYPYFAVLMDTMWTYCDNKWLQRGNQAKLDAIATYNMGQEL